MSRLTRQYKNRAQNRSVKLKDLVAAAKSIGVYYRKIDYNGTRSNMTGDIVSCPLFESVLALWWAGRWDRKYPRSNRFYLFQYTLCSVFMGLGSFWYRWKNALKKLLEIGKTEGLQIFCLKKRLKFWKQRGSKLENEGLTNFTSL